MKYTHVHTASFEHRSHLNSNADADNSSREYAKYAHAQTQLMLRWHNTMRICERYAQSRVGNHKIQCIRNEMRELFSTADMRLDGSRRKQAIASQIASIRLCYSAFIDRDNSGNREQASTKLWLYRTLTLLGLCSHSHLLQAAVKLGQWSFERYTNNNTLTSLQ